MNNSELPYYSLQRAAAIIEQQTKLPCSVRDLFQHAANDELTICFYDRGFTYPETNTLGYEHEEVFCPPLRNYVLLPKKRGDASCIQRVYNRMNALEILTILNKIYANSLASDSRTIDCDSVQIRTFDMKALRVSDGQIVEVAMVSSREAPREGNLYIELMEWFRKENIPPYHLEPDEASGIDEEGINIDGNLFMNEGITRINMPALCVAKYFLDDFLIRYNNGEIASLNIPKNQAFTKLSPLQELEKKLIGNPENQEKWILMKLQEFGYDVEDFCSIPVGKNGAKVKIKDIAESYGIRSVIDDRWNELREKYKCRRV